MVEKRVFIGQIYSWCLSFCIICLMIIGTLSSANAESQDILLQKSHQKLDSIVSMLNLGSEIQPAVLFDAMDKLDILILQITQSLTHEQKVLKSLQELVVSTKPDPRFAGNTSSYELLLASIEQHKQQVMDASLCLQSLYAQKKRANELSLSMPITDLFKRVPPVWDISWLVINQSLHQISFKVFYERSGLQLLSQSQINLCKYYLLLWLLFALCAYLVPSARFNKQKWATGRLKFWYRLIRQTVVFLLPAMILYITLHHILNHQSGLLVIFAVILRCLAALYFVFGLYLLYKHEIYSERMVEYYNIWAIVSIPLVTFVGVHISRYTSQTHQPHLLFNSPFAYIVVYTAVAAKLLVIVSRHTAWDKSRARNLYMSTVWLIVSLSCLLVVRGYFDSVGVNAELKYLVSGLFLIVTNALILYNIWIMLSAAYIPVFCRALWARNSIKIMIASYICLITIGLCGYEIFSIMFILKLLATYMVVGLLIDNFHFLRKTYDEISDPTQALSLRVRALAGLKSGKRLYEMYAFAVAIYINILLMAAITFVYIWQLVYARFVIRDLIARGYAGFNVLGFIFNPISFLKSVVVFSAWIFCSRIFVSSFVVKRMSFESEHIQRKVISILHILFFLLGLLVFLRMNHVDIRSFVVIAGALSVGIGFGFQRFASDLLSGWFLLLNKPFNAGDHIRLDGIGEGIVHNIGMLSTHLITNKHSDEFVPNSVFTTSSVINLTYRRNMLSCVTVHVVLDDLANTDVAKDILINTARQNTQIKQDPPDNPQVLFNCNGLDLSVVILDVEQKSFIMSELICDIESLFRAKNIHIILSDI